MNILTGLIMALMLPPTLAQLRAMQQQQQALQQQQLTDEQVATLDDALRAAGFLPHPQQVHTPVDSRTGKPIPGAATVIADAPQLQTDNLSDVVYAGQDGSVPPPVLPAVQDDPGTAAVASNSGKIPNSKPTKGVPIPIPNAVPGTGTAPTPIPNAVPGAKAEFVNLDGKKKKEPVRPSDKLPPTAPPTPPAGTPNPATKPGAKAETKPNAPVNEGTGQPNQDSVATKTPAQLEAERRAMLDKKADSLYNESTKRGVLTPQESTGRTPTAGDSTYQRLRERAKKLGKPIGGLLPPTVEMLRAMQNGSVNDVNVQTEQQPMIPAGDTDITGMVQNQNPALMLADKGDVTNENHGPLGFGATRPEMYTPSAWETYVEGNNGKTYKVVPTREGGWATVDATPAMKFAPAAAGATPGPVAARFYAPGGVIAQAEQRLQPDATRPEVTEWGLYNYGPMEFPDGNVYNLGIDVNGNPYIMDKDDPVSIEPQPVAYNDLPALGKSVVQRTTYNRFMNPYFEGGESPAVRGTTPAPNDADKALQTELSRLEPGQADGLITSYKDAEKKFGDKEKERFKTWYTSLSDMYQQLKDLSAPAGQQPQQPVAPTTMPVNPHQMNVQAIQELAKLFRGKGGRALLNQAIARYMNSIAGMMSGNASVQFGTGNSNTTQGEIPIIPEEQMVNMARQLATQDNVHDLRLPVWDDAARGAMQRTIGQWNTKEYYNNLEAGNMSAEDASVLNPASIAQSIGFYQNSGDINGLQNYLGDVHGRIGKIKYGEDFRNQGLGLTYDTPNIAWTAPEFMINKADTSKQENNMQISQKQPNPPNPHNNQPKNKNTFNSSIGNKGSVSLFDVMNNLRNGSGGGTQSLQVKDLSDNTLKLTNNDPAKAKDIAEKMQKAFYNWAKGLDVNQTWTIAKRASEEMMLDVANLPAAGKLTAGKTVSLIDTMTGGGNYQNICKALTGTDSPSEAQLQAGLMDPGKVVGIAQSGWSMANPNSITKQLQTGLAGGYIPDTITNYSTKFMDPMLAAGYRAAGTSVANAAGFNDTDEVDIWLWTGAYQTSNKNRPHR